jgi:hypothetical protein
LCVAAALDDAKNADFPWSCAVEDHIIVHREGADVWSLGGFQILADVRNLANKPNLSVIEAMTRVAYSVLLSRAT